MKIIVGLGNPGEKYNLTRHNVGFMTVEKLAQESEIAPVGDQIDFNYDKKSNTEIAGTKAKGEKIIIIKPHAFMNLSGEAVSKVMQFYKADISDLIVIHDDVDIPLGEAKIKLDGSSAGHKGVQNIIDMLGSDRFIRIRIGIMPTLGGAKVTEDMDGPIETKDFVLAKFADREVKIIDNIIDIINEYILGYIGAKEPVKATTLSTKLPG